MTFYDRAKTVFPHEGKIFYQLGSISVREHDYLNALNLFMRALSCSFPHQASRENLINLLQDIRMRDIDASKLEVHPGKLKVETVSDTRFAAYLNCFGRLQKLLYTRIGVDEFDRVFNR